MGYGLWFSAMMYDSAAQASIEAKKATGFQNFYLSSVDCDQGVLVIQEEYVDDATDWANKAKFKSRELATPFPAAE